MFDRSSQLVVIAGTHSDAGGYAYNNRNVFKGLHSLGWKMGLESIPGTQEISEKEIGWFNKFRLFNESNRPMVFPDTEAVKIFSHIPLVNVPQYKRNIIYTMTETRNPHPNFIKWCNKFYNELWTPTEWNRKSFESNGLEIPSKTVPIGIEMRPEDISNDKNAIGNLKYIRYGDGPESPSGYKFLSVSRWSYRKGFDVLIRAFLQEFTKDDGVCLVIHSRHAAMSHHKNFYDYVKNDLQTYWDKSKRENSAPIYLCMDIVPAEHMPNFYSQANCFVSTSRGEGLALPVLEASSMGCPVIVPNHTGFTDYANENNSFQFGVDKWVVCDSIPEWRRGGWITPMFSQQEFPLFGEETVSEVRGVMRFVFDNPEEAKRRNDNLKSDIIKNFNWNTIISGIDTNLLEICEC